MKIYNSKQRDELYVTLLLSRTLRLKLRFSQNDSCMETFPVSFIYHVILFRASGLSRTSPTPSQKPARIIHLLSTLHPHPPCARIAEHPPRCRSVLTLIVLFEAGPLLTMRAVLSPTNPSARSKSSPKHRSKTVLSRNGFV